MDSDTNAAQPKSRRRFQFSLRTLLIGVALLAVPCAYVAHEARIVAARKAWLESHPNWHRFELREQGHIGEYVMPKPLRSPDRSSSPHLIRRWLGDKDIPRVSVTSEEFEEAVALFPEAEFFSA